MPHRCLGPKLDFPHACQSVVIPGVGSLMTKRKRTAPRVIRFVLLGLLGLLLVGLLVGFVLFRGSLPRLNGEVRLPSLTAPVTVERDELGTVTIRAASALDASRALGYVHAQERYFHMDTLRRLTAGELGELVNADLLELDQQKRLHRVRARVEENLAAFTGDYAAETAAYVEGVNAGLADLRFRPWPYLLLGKQPEPWTVVDSALTGYALFFDLQEGQLVSELNRLTVGQEVPQPLLDLITHESSAWDAPLFGDDWGYAALPTAAELDYRELPVAASAPPEPLAQETPGSNNFAISGELTADGRAILANDMHLGLTVPNIWQRVHLIYDDPRAPDGVVDVHGVTLPGLPAVVAGDNGAVAWGYTNAYADSADFMYYDPACTADPACFDVTSYEESITTTAGAQSFTIEETSWGPVVRRDEDGGALALRWVAHQPGSLSLNLMDFVLAQDLDELFAYADGASVPIQNLVAADASGRIGWRILGALPDRAEGCGLADFELYYDASQGCEPWPVRTDIAPSLVDPESGRLWTANARVVGEEGLAAVGSGGYALGVRGWQIRDLLMAQDEFDEEDLYAIQLDDRALLLEGWWELFRAAVGDSSDPSLQRLEETTRTWEGHAASDAISYRVAREFRDDVHAIVQHGLLAPFTDGTPAEGLRPGGSNVEGWLWPLASEQPPHLLPGAYTSWGELFEDAIRVGIERQEAANRDPYTATWGETNVASICHQFAGFLPGPLGSYLCMPATELTGDNHVPRVARPDFGASQRTVVSPGHEEDGIMQLPGGQSGHPLSQYWGAGHDAWLSGEVTPFLPGEAAYTLNLRP